MIFTRHNLPKTYLKPPFPPPYTQKVPHPEETWRRDWSVYYICTNWGDSDWGKLGVVRDWLAKVSKSDPVTKQRIAHIVMQVQWLLRDRMEWNAETREIIDRYTPRV